MEWPLLNYLYGENQKMYKIIIICYLYNSHKKIRNTYVFLKIFTQILIDEIIKNEDSLYHKV